MQRAKAQRFMGGWWAFPGGGLASGDAALEVVGEVAVPPETDPMGALPEAMLDGIELGELLIPGLVAAALRELVEEMGWWVGEELVEVNEADLARLRQKETTIADLAEKYGPFDAGKLTYAGRWLTPPLGPMRFDNRFFLLDADGLEPRPWEREVEAAEWIDPGEALERWHTGGCMIAPPVRHLLRVLAEDSLDRLDRLVDPQEANLGPFRRIEFQPDVLLFPQRTLTLPPAATTNCVVVGGEERILIDPGSSLCEEQERLLRGLDELEGGRTSIREIWLTHHHPDHIGGAKALAQELGVSIVAHPITAELLRGRIAIDRTVEDGERVALAGDPGMELEVLHTPGHAPGHICLAIVNPSSEVPNSGAPNSEATAGQDRRWVLAGDMISGVSTIIIDPPTGNMGDYYRSLERLRDLDFGVMLPAHGPPMLDGHAVFERTLRHRRKREERIREAWERGVRKKGQLVKAAYDEELPPFVVPLAMRQVAAHLEHLELERLDRKEGRREVSGDLPA